MSMLYSICSMQFWINKSNLVCADVDLAAHLCRSLTETIPDKEAFNMVYLASVSKYQLLKRICLYIAK